LQGRREAVKLSATLRLPYGSHQAYISLQWARHAVDRRIRGSDSADCKILEASLSIFASRFRAGGARIAPSGARKPSDYGSRGFNW
jgi:hypothetical protein